MNITAIHLNRSDDKVEVNIEVEGRWYQVIEENIDGFFSWITEESGMQRNIIQNKRPMYENHSNV